MDLSTMGKKWAWVYAKYELMATDNARNPVFGYKEMPSGEKDFIAFVYNCPKTNEIIEVYEQSKTIVRFVNKGIYPLDKSKRNKCKVRIKFSDGTVFNVDYADSQLRKTMSAVKPVI